MDEALINTNVFKFKFLSFSMLPYIHDIQSIEIAFPSIPGADSTGVCVCLSACMHACVPVTHPTTLVQLMYDIECACVIMLVQNHYLKKSHISRK